MTTLNEDNTPKQDEEELIPVDTPPEAQQSDAEDEPDDEDQDDDDRDDRLAASEDDTDEEIAKASNRDRRKKRRELQRMAKERAEREIAELRRRVQAQEQQLAQLTGHAQSTVAQNLEAKIAQTQRDIRQAEMIIAKAVEAGNGEDVAAAIRIRDQAAAELNQLASAKQQMEQRQQQAARPQAPQVDPTVVSYAQQWLAANPWYDPNGGDRDSALTKAIDNEIMAEGYDPRTRDYWEELTARVAEALGENEKPKPAAQAKRKGPPTGGTRNNAPVSTRKEIYVTPERKAAMIEAGVWDDPVKRQKVLKAYAEHDAQQSAR